MKTQLIAALLVAVSAAVAAPAFAGSETTVTRAQVRAELVQLQQAGYVPGRANDPHYPDDLQAALTRIRTNDAVAADMATSGYGNDAAASTQSGHRPATRIAERSIYFGH
ncbi:DUF4148 domain-containing protein [Burkholderia latens]|uniref:DUF4148 domain-containing protein n=1 Tax=Burkholderia latens TaxID=488446 RepID=A0A6H9SJD5_9BURK|nr:DUF4148 domain-containing protein [Burkholderia latens]KAB0632541.1 DUF4148 domain-containing protein [Burkholderia latens]VWC11999.1 membrane protein [Burkholderia latens]